MRTALLIALLLACTESIGQRIVSLVPSVTQTLQQIGADETVVARTTYCPQGEKTESIIVGDAMTVNIEKIVGLKPDCVITMGLTPQKSIEQMKKLGIRVIELHTPTSLDEICQQTLLLGELSGHLADAQKEVEIEQQRTKDIASNFQTTAKKAFFQIGTRPLWGAIPNSYLDDIMKKLGLTNIITSGNGATSREFVIGAKPDVIILTTMSGHGKYEAESWSKATSSSIVTVDESVACCPTPSNYRKTIESITRQLSK